MTDAQTNDPASIAADIARELREHPERWTQNRYARDSGGEPLDDPKHVHAVCWCLYGHIRRRLDEEAMGEGVASTHGAFIDAIRRASPMAQASLVIWNDRYGRTVGEVIALCDAVANNSALKDAQP